MLKSWIFFLSELCLILNISFGEKTLSVPVGGCTDGAATMFTYNNNGACGYGSLTGATGPGYLYGIGPNEAFYNKAEKCGICYEIVGPKGAVRAMVVDMCPANSENPLCHGQYTLFDLTTDTFQLIGYESTGGANITFREVSCDVEGPVKVHVNTGSSNTWMSVLVFNHAVGITNVEYLINEQWVSATRSDSNHWVILPASGSVLSFPVSLRITGKGSPSSTVTASIKTSTAGSIYNADGQLAVPSTAVSAGSDKCCEERDTFSVIYRDGLTSEWHDWSYCATNDFGCTSVAPHSGSKCIETKFEGYGQITLGTGTPAKESQFSEVSFWVRGPACTDCFVVKARGGTEGKELSMSVAVSDAWNEVRAPFDKIGVQNGEFLGLVVQSKSDKDVTYYFDDVTLVRKAGSSLEKCASTTKLFPKQVLSSSSYSYHSPSLSISSDQDSKSGCASNLSVFMAIIIIGLLIFL